MILADTNVVLGFVRDMTEEQEAAFEDSLALMEAAGESMLATEATFVECAWVLASFYHQTPDEVADTMDLVLSTETIVAWDPGVARAALAIMRAEPKLDAADCLLAARVECDGVDVATLDRRLRNAILSRASTRD